MIRAALGDWLQEAVVRIAMRLLLVFLLGVSAVILTVRVLTAQF